MITSVSPILHPQLPGVSVYPLMGEKLRKGQAQLVLVQIGPSGIVPVHTHGSTAEMFITAGEAEVLSDDIALNAQRVNVGHCVKFAANVGHGFRAGPAGMSFISRNGGIVDIDGDWDITFPN